MRISFLVKNLKKSGLFERTESLEDPIVKAFLETLQSEEFKMALEAMGGYRIDPFECLMIGGEA